MTANQLRAASGLFLFAVAAMPAAPPTADTVRQSAGYYTFAAEGGAQYGSVQADSILRKALLQTFGADGILQKSGVTGSVTADATL